MKQKQNRFNPNNLLTTMEQLLVGKPSGWFSMVVTLNNNLVDYLRGKGPDPKWELFPISRSWFSQNTLYIKVAKQ